MILSVILSSILMSSIKSNEPEQINQIWDNTIPFESTDEPNQINGSFNYCEMLEFVNRSTWEAEEADASTSMVLPIDKVFIDYTYSDRCSSLYQCSYELRQTQDYHKRSIGLFDIAYNFMIGDDAKVYVGRDYTVARAFDEGYNNNSLLIGFIGDYDDTISLLPRSLDIAYKVIRCGQQKGYITNKVTIFEPVAEFCGLGPGKKLYKYIVHNRFRSVNYKCLASDRLKFHKNVKQKKKM